MPKIVDHEQRRRELAEALWRVVARSGPAAVSIRTVAAEAGWSAGALRHYFQTRDQLLEFAIELTETRVAQRIRARQEAASEQEPALERAAGFIEELLPLDEQRRVEFLIWQAVGERFHPAGDEGAKQRWALQRGLYRQVVAAVADRSGLAEPTEAHPDAWVETWAAYLHVFTDGLATQLMFAPAQVTQQEARRTLRGFLGELARLAQRSA